MKWCRSDPCRITGSRSRNPENPSDHGESNRQHWKTPPTPILRSSHRRCRSDPREMGIQFYSRTNRPYAAGMEVRNQIGTLPAVVCAGLFCRRFRSQGKNVDLKFSSHRFMKWCRSDPCRITGSRSRNPEGPSNHGETSRQHRNTPPTPILRSSHGWCRNDPREMWIQFYSRTMMWRHRRIKLRFN